MKLWSILARTSLTICACSRGAPSITKSRTANAGADFVKFVFTDTSVWRQLRPENAPRHSYGLPEMRKGLHDFFGYGLGLREKVEVIRAARLGICARHVESAEGMSAHHGPGALAVDVEIADVKVAGGTVDFVARFGIDGAGQAELSVVGDFESVIEPAGFDDGQHWAENFFLLELRFRGDVGEDGNTLLQLLGCDCRQ
jgi:hypothetical protein